MFFNIELVNKNDLSLLRTVENTCLKPVRYLFKGRTIEILNDQIIKDEPSFGPRTYLGMALAIATFIPGLIFGILAKALNSLGNRYRNDQAFLKQFLHVKPSLPSAPAMTLDAYLQNFWPKIDALRNQIKDDEAIWKDGGFIQECSQIMEEGYASMELYFRQLAKECNSDPVLMKEQMIMQPQNRETPSQDYSHTFFIFSKLYHQARSCATQLDRKTWADPMGMGDHEPMPIREKEFLTEEDQEPYFNPTKPQYRWRQLYNAFCDLVDKYGVRSHLEKRGGDTRFSNWSHPDTQKVFGFYYPDTLPT
jgi:hypothetical protein